MQKATYKKKTVTNPRISIIPIIPTRDFEKIKTPYPNNPPSNGYDLENNKEHTNEIHKPETNSLLAVLGRI
jgi:hypothetical protein